MSTRRQHNRLDKIEQDASTGDEPTFLVGYAPSWVEDDEAVPPPPERLDSPVWTKADGWVDGAGRELVIKIVPPKEERR